MCPFRAESLFPTVPWLSCIQASLASKSVIPGARLPSAGPVGWGAQCVARTPCFLGQTSAIVIILTFVGCIRGDVGLDYTVSLPLLPIHCESFLNL